MRYNERHIFPGANTPIGFYSYYDNIVDRKNAVKMYCLKGGPGVGKSSYMKRIADVFAKEGESIEYFHCSSDPHSLDGIRLCDREVVLVDGTAPHVIDPCYPAAVDEIINLGQFWYEREIKRHKDEIIATQYNISYEFGRAYKYLSAAASIAEDTERIYADATDSEALNKAANELVERIFTESSPTFSKRVRRLFASALTPAGLVNYADTVLYDCKRVYGLLIGDNVGSFAGADEVMNRIVAEAGKRGYMCEAYYCPMKPVTRIEHIVIPQLEVGITLLNKYNNDDTVATEIINLMECVNRARVRGSADKIEENNGMYHSLLQTAQTSLKDAYWLHNTLESYYVPYIDFDRVSEHCTSTIDAIKESFSDNE